MTACPRGAHRHVVTSGRVGSTQRWRCRGGGDRFTRTTPRGRPLWQKALALFRHGHGVSMHALGSMLAVRASSVLNWSRRYATAHDEKPAPSGKVGVMDRDEMGHVLPKTAEALDVEGS